MKKNIISLIVLVGIIIAGVFYFTILHSPKDISVDSTRDIVTNNTQLPGQTPEPIDESKTVIGTSVEKRDIVAYHYGTGDTELLFVGGIHGGYEWNTTLVAYEFMDYLEANPKVIPENIKITIIPVLNPDGLNGVVGTTSRFTQADVSVSPDLVVSGRFNANGVDLNRNFDCDWQANGVWQKTTVSGGTSIFSELESLAIKNYVETHNLTAVVVWYSAAGGVFASSCHNGVSAETKILTEKYATASGYKAYNSFDFYETTGDMVNWFAKKNIPAISVILTTHNNTEWSKNKAGIEALLKYYTN